MTVSEGAPADKDISMRVNEIMKEMPSVCNACHIGAQFQAIILLFLTTRKLI